MRNAASRILLSLILIALLAPLTRAEDKPAPKEPPFEKEIAAFEESDKKSPPPSGGIEFIGSSSIKKWTGVKKDFPSLPVYNRGFGGSQAYQATMYADRIVIPYKPKTIVFYSGDNDLGSGKSPETVAVDYAAFIAKVQKALPDTKFIVLSVKPSLKREKLMDKQRQTNKLLQEMAAKDADHVTYLDVFTPMLTADGKLRPELYVADGLHMTPIGYQLWTELLTPLLGGK